MINFNIKCTHHRTVSRTELCRNNRRKYSTIKFLLQYNIDTFINHVKRIVEYLTLRSYSQGKLDTVRDHLYRTAWHYPILLIRKTFATRCRDLWHRHTPWHMVNIITIIIMNVVGGSQTVPGCRNSDSTVTIALKRQSDSFHDLNQRKCLVLDMVRDWPNGMPTAIGPRRCRLRRRHRTKS